MIALVLASHGCKSEADRRLEADLANPAPLPHDPTDKFKLARWWSNGEQLLRLDETSAYSLYDSQNRYAAPRERGRWWQQSYAVLWLEPYKRLKPESKRVAITRIDGRLAVEVPTLRPMFPIAAPPAAPEDKLIGQWRGAIGELRLGSDLRYSFAPATASANREPGAIIAGHSGNWSLSGGTLVLQPDSPAMQPLTFTVKPTDAGAILEHSAGALSAVADSDA